MRRIVPATPLRTRSSAVRAPMILLRREDRNDAFTAALCQSGVN
jgi:hypothetical protein